MEQDKEKVSLYDIRKDKRDYTSKIDNKYQEYYDEILKFRHYQIGYEKLELYLMKKYSGGLRHYWNDILQEARMRTISKISLGEFDPELSSLKTWYENTIAISIKNVVNKYWKINNNVYNNYDQLDNITSKSSSKDENKMYSSHLIGTQTMEQELETNISSFDKEFVEDYLSGDFTTSELRTKYNIKYKWRTKDINGKEKSIKTIMLEITEYNQGEQND